MTYKMKSIFHHENSEWDYYIQSGVFLHFVYELEPVMKAKRKYPAFDVVLTERRIRGNKIHSMNNNINPRIA